MARDLSIKVNGINFENPFVIGSGPPGTNRATISKAFKEGWGGVVAKTISLDGSAVKNVAPRYGKLYARESGDVIGFQNIELISDRALDEWLKDFEAVKKEYPRKVLIASLMEAYDKSAWQRLTRTVCQTGVDALELNFSCPHGMPEKKMGSAMGQCPEVVKEVTRWVKEVSPVPVWAKMTPNIMDISVPSLEAIAGGADGISLINTILAVIGIDLKTLRPLPTVSGHSIPGGYSGQAIRPIALRHVLDLARALKTTKQEHITMSGIGGVECGKDALEFILMGCHTVQSCTAPMLQGFGMVEEMITTTQNFMQEHGFNSIEQFRGHSLSFFTTHAHLVELKQGKFEKGQVARDTEWSGDEIAKQTRNMSNN
ncbi:MAG: NAD-dependent dihydropyrimidine dehydrogenase subunit PreA [Bdellovibrio sp.]|nr:NAD-dependent dihydropyrimidine dehydrogenase subunit PreA [Bdellovibrio sp.]